MGRYLLGDIQVNIKKLKDGFESGSGSTVLRYQHKDGHYIWLEVKGNAFTDKTGKRKVILMGRDISEYKKIEQQLKDINKYYFFEVRGFYIYSSSFHLLRLFFT